MKLARPDVPNDLQPVTDLAALLRKDEVLSGLSIQDVDVAELRAKGMVLHESSLVKCNFAQASLEKAQLRDCVMEACDLTATVLADSSWHALEVNGSRCSGLQLQNSLLKNVRFRDCKLDLANFRFARLEHVVFENCMIKDLDLYNAQAKHVAFIGCDIEDVEFSGAQLHDVDLTESALLSIKGLHGLKGASISQEQLVRLAPYMATELGLVVKD